MGKKKNASFVSKLTFGGTYPGYGWFSNDLAKMGGAAGYTNWDEVMTDAFA